MHVLSKRKHSVPVLLAILIIFISKSTSEEGLQVKTNGVNQGTPKSITSKVQEGNPKENAPPNLPQEKIEEPKADQLSYPDDKEENQHTKTEESELPSQVDGAESKQTNGKVEEADLPPQVVDLESKQSNGKVEEADQQPSAPQEEQVEDANASHKLTEETKKQNEKINDNIRKISLTDVNSISYDESQMKQAKRETKTMEFLGLPRDASYFFDDLEPFINNNNAKEKIQENSRGTRAIPSRENKALKSKLAKKGMLDENIEEDEEEEEDDNEKAEEKEKETDEEDYDDDGDIEPDCQPTTEDPECTSSTECEPPTTECSPTTKCPTTPSTCRTTPRTRRTTKCTTTKPTCTTTKCTTPTESVKCPKICGKGTGKAMRYPIGEKTKSWDSDEKRTRKKFHNKNPLQSLS